jgi:general secretion pathway protein A
MLSNLETQDAKLLQILLVGQPELRDKLAVPELRQLNQRIALRYHLLPLTEDEVRGYIAYRLRMANGGERVFFTPEAMGAIYCYSGGIPRLINILCDKALLAAFVAESRVVSKEIVGDAISDLEGLVKGRRSHRIKGAAPFPPDQWHAVEKLKQRVSPIGLGIFIFFFLSTLGGVAFWWLTQLPDPSLREARVEESQPVPLPARVEGIRPDSDGIFREESAEDSRRGALLTLMALWDPRFYEDALWDRMKEAGSDVMGLVRSEGFELVPIPMELELVNRLDYPVLMELDEGVERGRHSVVLWQIQGEEALVLDPLRGRESYPLERLESIWGEKGEILWRPLDGIGFRMAVGEHGTQVARLQGLLKERGFYEGEVDGKFGLLTQEGVYRLQKRSGLQVDGVFGVESALILKKQVFGQGVPSLQQKPLIPAIDSKSIPRPS